MGGVLVASIEVLNYRTNTENTFIKFYFHALLIYYFLNWIYYFEVDYYGPQ